MTQHPEDDTAEQPATRSSVPFPSARASALARDGEQPAFTQHDLGFVHNISQAARDYLAAFFEHGGDRKRATEASALTVAQVEEFYTSPLFRHALKACYEKQAQFQALGDGELMAAERQIFEANVLDIWRTNKVGMLELVPPEQWDQRALASFMIDKVKPVQDKEGNIVGQDITVRRDKERLGIIHKHFAWRGVAELLRGLKAPGTYEEVPPEAKDGMIIDLGDDELVNPDLTPVNAFDAGRVKEELDSLLTSADVDLSDLFNPIKGDEV